MMKEELAKYLSDVFRNSPDGTDSAETAGLNQAHPAPIIDRHRKQFIVDQKYSLRLDEII